MRLILAVDAGGTSTRAAVFDASGRCAGFGRAGTGNPTAVGIGRAVDAIAAAAETALRSAERALPAGGVHAAIALAGEETAAFHDAVAARLAPLGIERVAVVPDLLGMFHSATIATDGHVLIAGTGAVAGRVTDGLLVRVAGGAGWLLGDAGSGFWIGHRVVRAVVEDLDSRGTATALTDLVLAELGVERTDQRDDGSSRTIRRLVSILYAAQPIELARFAPLAFAAVSDSVAARIVDEASDALGVLLDAVGEDPDRTSRPATGPVVVGGSIAGRLLDRRRGANGSFGSPSAGVHQETRDGTDSGMPLADHPLLTAAPPLPASDGLLGAAVLAFRESGAPLDVPMFERLGDTLAARRVAPVA